MPKGIRKVFEQENWFTKLNFQGRNKFYTLVERMSTLVMGVVLEKYTRNHL